MTLVAAGAVASVIGYGVVLHAETALSRAIGWYNKELPPKR
ncbi:MAG: hypothetical protein ACHQQ3_14135 [Gemmatimonadales bacterium]